MFQPYVHIRKVALALMFTAAWLLAVAGTPARALQEPPAVKALLDLLRVELQLEPKVGSMRTEGDAIVLEDVVLAEVRKDGRTTLSARVKEIRLTGATTGDGGLMFYRHIRVDDLTIELAAREGEQPMRVVAPRMTFVEASVLPYDSARTPQEEFASAQLMAAATDIPEIRLEFPGMRPIIWTGLRGTWKGDRRTGTGETRADMGTLPLPLMELAKLDARNGAKLQETLAALGLKQITLRGTLASKSGWTPDQRLMTSATLRLGAPEAGELAIDVKDIAMPLELVRKARKMARGMAGKPLDKGQQTPRNGMPQLPGMPGMQGGNPMNDPELAMSARRLTLGGLTLRWRDHGLVRRLLEWEASRKGMDVSELVAQKLEEIRAPLSAALPAETLTDYLRELSHFLQEPRSLRISIEGANGQPISLAGVMVFLIAPQMLANSLKVEVKANEGQ